MKFPVTATREHQGKTLSIDCDQETLSLFDDTGQRLSILTWGTLIEHMLSVDEDARFAHSRAHPRAPLAIKVHCTTGDGKHFDSLTGGISGGGLFIESSAPLAPGTELKVEFALPDRPSQKFETRRWHGHVQNPNDTYYSPEWAFSSPISTRKHKHGSLTWLPL